MPIVKAANQKLSSIFFSPPRYLSFSSSSSRSDRPDKTDAQALREANAAQHAYLTRKSSASLPTISLSTDTASGEKYATPSAHNAVDSSNNALFRPSSPEDIRRQAKKDAEFGPICSHQHRYSSRFHGAVFPEPIEDEPPYFYLLTTYVSYLILIIVGHIRDFFGKRFKARDYIHLRETDGYAPLNSDFDSFYTRRLKHRLNGCFSRPTTGVPGRFINLVDRTSDDYQRTFKLTGTTTETLNVSSYNYLGFAQSEGPCATAAEQAIRKYGITLASNRSEAGTSDLHMEVEDLVADFVGKEDAMVFSMGFGTNASAFPALVGRGCLVISDELNHASIRTGVRLSGASVSMFKHNDMRHLERQLREVISQGQPRTHRPWKKILVVVEGLYSMEGTICNLPALIRLRRKYKFYLFVDEAHSIGAIGPRGRGVCDYFGVDTREVDILMGTLTKSFGANGGYIAADHYVIEKLRVTNAGVLYSESPAPAVLAQIASSLRIINGESHPGQGEERLQRLAFNSRYLRLGLKRLGFIVAGHDDSPVIPVMVYHPAKIKALSEEMLARKISIVVVGYPATPLVSSRTRFCVSAAHTKDDLDRLLVCMNEMGNVLQLKYSSGIAGGQEPIPDGLPNNEEVERRRAFELQRSRGVIKGKAKGKVKGPLPYKPPRWRLEDVLERGVADVKVPLR